MGFRVPWRCLVPEDAVEAVFGAEGGRAVEEATGAQIHISGEGEAPETLSDKIVTVEGSAQQKEEACRLVLKDLWTSQGIPGDEEGIFVLVVPARVVGAIIGTKGAKVNEIMGGSGADLNVGRECIIGMPDNPVVVKGTQEQALTATAMVHVVLQELVDRGRLEPGDFRWSPGRAAEAPRQGPRGGFGSSTAARFRFASGVAGFVIGKGGLKIKRLKEESGALLQFRSAEEEPTLALGEDERVLEIRGAPAARDQAVRSLFLSLDEMPDGPQGTRMLVPTTLERAALEEMSFSLGVELSLGKDTRLSSPEPGEVTAELQGPAPARLEVVLAALRLLDSRAGATGDAPPSPAPPPRARPSAAEPTYAAAPPSIPVANGGASTNGRAFQEAMPVSARPIEAPEGGRQAVERRVEPESGKAFTFQEFQVAFAGTYSEEEIRDYWRDACKPAPAEAAGRPEMASAPRAPEVPVETNGYGQQGGGGTLDNDQGWQQQQHEREQREREQQQQQQQQHGYEQHPLGEASQPFTQQTPALSPDFSMGLGGSSSCCGSFAPFCRAQDVGMGMAMGGLGLSPGMCGAGGQFLAAPTTRLNLVLPAEVVRRVLVPSGQLAEIARGCNIRIDLCEEVFPNGQRVVLTGTCLANSLALLALQGRVWFAQAAAAP